MNVIKSDQQIDVPAVQLIYLKVNVKNTRKCSPTGKCSQVGIFLKMYIPLEKKTREIIAKPQQRVTAAHHRTDEQWCKNNNT